MTHTTPKPVVLCILDGWGYREEGDFNAIAAANTPHYDHILNTYPYSTIKTSGADVGLPDGQMGNSEVGHMTIGSGRIVLQTLPRIDQSIADGSLQQNPALKKLVTALKASGGTCHLMGLLSDGGVHAHIDHIIALAGMVAEQGVPVAIHAFMDGRDTPPKSGVDYIRTLESAIAGVDHIMVATVSGRYYAMDRDKRWERVEKAYDALAEGKGEQASTPLEAVEQSYNKDVADEFILPTVMDGYGGMQDGDGLLMANFRADRARQILDVLVDPAFDGFAPGKKVKFAVAVGAVDYSETLSQYLETLFPVEIPQQTLGQIAAERGLKQLRIAETEKYAHVTFFFNGGVEQVFEGEDRILVPSPKVATYDLQPEMSAPEVTDKLVEAIESGKYDLIVANYANTDMVGHSGLMEAAVKAVETVDEALGRLEKAALAQGGVLLITADHGNAEQMIDPETEGSHTQHTTNPVPFIVMGAGDVSVQKGGLADIAPTILQLMHISQPAEMTGKSLIS